MEWSVLQSDNFSMLLQTLSCIFYNLNTEEYMSVGKGNRIPNAVDKQKLIEDDEGPGVEMQEFTSGNGHLNSK